MLNPVLRREAKTSLRSWKIYALIMAHAGFIAFVAFMFIGINAANRYMGFDPQLIIYLYILMCAFQMALIMISTPALTAGSISGERERQTLDLLLVTKMRPISIITGKMVAGLSIVLLMIVSSLPVFAIVFYFGGISIGTFLKMTVFMIVTSCMAGAVSILLSTIIKKSMISTVLVYLIFGVLCIGTLVGVFLYYGLLYSRYYALNITTPFELGILSKIFINILLSINPGVAFFSLIENQFGMNIVSDVISVVISVGSNTILDNIWIFNIIFNIVVTGILLVLSSKFINPLRKK